MSKAGIMRFDATRARELLTDGMAEMTLAINQGQMDALLEYLSLMAKWNPVYNLTAIRQTDEIVSAHLLDSLAIIGLLDVWLTNKPKAKILDVGTGGGLPGVVLAIMRPQWSLTLIDPVHKKTAFLQQVKAQLQLDNLTVINGKVEDLPTEAQFDLITSRAFSSLINFVQLSEHVLQADGCFAAMKGVFPSEEMDALQQTFNHQWQIEPHEIHVPQLNAQRHLIKISRSNPSHHPK